MAMPATAEKTTAQFRTFLECSRVLLAKRAHSSSVEPFQRFIAAATPLVLSRIRSLLPLLVKQGPLIYRWLASQDLLAVAGLSHLENPYTELVAWVLAPNTHPETATRRQRAWLRMLHLDDHVDFTHPALSRTQFVTDNGIIDIILEYSNSVLVVETKTKTFEHAAPSGVAQTIAYIQSVRNRLVLTDFTAVHLIFLTPDGHLAENPDAIPATFLQLVLALATEISPDELPPDLRWAFSTVFTHLLTHAGPAGIDIHAVLERIAQWGDGPTFLENETALIASLGMIQQAVQFLLRESKS